AGSLGMRHQSDDVPPPIAEAGNGVGRTIGVCRIVELTLRRGVTKHDLVVGFELCERVRRRVVVAFTVRDRNAEDLSDRRTASERRVGSLDPNVDVLTAKLQPAIS